MLWVILPCIHFKRPPLWTIPTAIILLQGEMFLSCPQLVFELQYIHEYRLEIFLIVAQMMLVRNISKVVPQIGCPPPLKRYARDRQHGF